MKTLNTKLMILLAAFSVIGMGCTQNSLQASSSQSVNSISPIPDTTTGTGSGTGTSTTTGAKTVTFTPVSLSEFNSYVGTHPLNNPTNFQLTVSLSDAGGGRYGGTVSISYMDTGYQYNGTFTAGLGTNVSINTLQDNDVYEAEYNRWFTYNGVSAFSGYFQDSYGAIVLVVDNVVSQGDASGGNVVSGSVYYKNFAQAYATQSPYRKCWFIRTGPYNCRSTTVMDKSTPVPSDGYRKLGTFSGLSRSLAFQ